MEEEAAQPGAAALPRVGLLAADELRIEGLRAVLADGLRYELVVLDAPWMLREHALEVVVIDSSATGEPTELIGAFLRLQPRIRLIVLGRENDMRHIERIVGAGAKGYLTHTATEEEVRLALQVVCDGSIWAPRKVLSRLLERAAATGTVVSHDVHITGREREVLKLLCEGRPNREIAGELGVDLSTVKAHLGRLMRKAGVTNRTALGMRAVEQNWCDRGN